MSLIQEALKRQQQEYGKGATQETATAAVPEPPVTETMPVLEQPAASPEKPALKVQSSAPPVGMPPPAIPPPPPVSRHSSTSWVKIGGMAAAALVILLVGSLIAAKWVFKALPQKASPTVVGQPVVPPQPGPASPMAMPEAGKTNDARQTAMAATANPESPAPVEGSSETSSVSGAAAATVPTAQAPAAAQTPSLGTAKQAPSPSVTKPVTKKAPAVSPQWPNLKLTGMLSNMGADRGAAFINKQMVFVGGQIDGVTLVEIRADGVLLKYGEETKTLKMGGVVY